MIPIGSTSDSFLFPGPKNDGKEISDELSCVTRSSDDNLYEEVDSDGTRVERIVSIVTGHSSEAMCRLTMSLTSERAE